MRYPLLLPLPLFFHAGIALLNVTVDDTDPSIVYEGSWEPSRTHRSGLDYGGTHTLSSDPAANATFIFTGVAVYYIAPLWPYAVNTQLRLDGDPPVVVNLTDPASTPEIDGSESAMSSVVWSATGLANTTHRLLLNMAPTGRFIIADGITYTVDNGPVDNGALSLSSTLPVSSGRGTPTLSSPRTSTTAIRPPSFPTLPPTSSGTLTSPWNKRSIIAGTALGGAALVAACCAFYFLFYRPRRTARYAEIQSNDVVQFPGSAQTQEYGQVPLGYDTGMRQYRPKPLGSDDASPRISTRGYGQGPDTSVHSPLLSPEDASSSQNQLDDIVASHRTSQSPSADATRRSENHFYEPSIRVPGPAPPAYSER